MPLSSHGVHKDTATEIHHQPPTTEAQTEQHVSPNNNFTSANATIVDSDFRCRVLGQPKHACRPRMQFSHVELHADCCEFPPPSQASKTELMHGPHSVAAHDFLPLSAAPSDDANAEYALMEDETETARKQKDRERKSHAFKPTHTRSCQQQSPAKSRQINHLRSISPRSKNHANPCKW